MNKKFLQEIEEASKKYKNIKNRENELNEQKDVHDSFICVYNDMFIGLFKRINWSTEKRQNTKYFPPEYEAGSIYVGIDSDYIGMKLTHSSSHSESLFEMPGTSWTIIDDDVEKTYVANCHINTGMSFDDMRFIMYKEEKIDPYEIGKATPKEILDTLKYAADYYGLEKSKKKTL